MKTIILAGGYGTRISEETANKPKPMVTIGGQPILTHIMSTYAQHGFDDFIVACGYRGEAIKEYFSSYDIRSNNVRVDLGTGTTSVDRSHDVRWKVACIDTGLDTMTGGRIARLRDEVAGSTFMVTYGDGLADVDVTALVEHHKRSGKIATVTAVHPPARFGALTIDGDGAVSSFAEKPQSEAGWINGGFFVLEPAVFDYLPTDDTRFEGAPLTELASIGELSAFRHTGFWKPMDTLRERQELERMWRSGAAPWAG